MCLNFLHRLDSIYLKQYGLHGRYLAAYSLYSIMQGMLFSCYAGNISGLILFESTNHIGQPGALALGPRKGLTTLGLMYTVFPCISSAKGCFPDLNP
jgi:hypothetical protein